MSCCYDHFTEIILQNISEIPRKMKREADVMLELFRDLEQEDGVKVIIKNGPDVDLSDYQI